MHHIQQRPADARYEPLVSIGAHHGVGLATASLPVGKHARVVPLGRALHHTLSNVLE